MKTRTGQVTLAAICLLIGVMLVVQFRTQTKIQRSVLSEPATNQALIIQNLYDSNQALRKEVEVLLQQQEQYDRASERTDLNTMAEELSRLRALTGLGTASGTGVELRVEAPLTKEDLLDLLNELRNAGAEAISLNEQRLVMKSPVSEQQGALYVNGVPVQSPFVFQAIGHPEALEGALIRNGGVLTIVKSAYPGASFAVTKRDEVDLPAYDLGYQLSFARPVEN